MAAGMARGLRVERLDMTRPSEIGTLRERLAYDRLDVLIVNAGISDHNVPVAEIDEATFNEVMSTNALAPLKVIESLQTSSSSEGRSPWCPRGRGASLSTLFWARVVGAPGGRTSS